MKRLLILAVLLSTSCRREDVIEGETVASARAPTPHKLALRDGGSEHPNSGISIVKTAHKQPTEDEEPAPYPTEYIDKMLEKTFGDAARHTSEELKVIEFVAGYMSEAENNAFPKPHRYLVRRHDGVWIVSVMSLEALRMPGLRASELLVYVRQRSRGLVVEKTAIKT